ncbi:MAG: LLM class F420-dependent oxidoreductase [Myxococcota bacterium]
MQLGLQIPDFTWPGGPRALADRLRRIAEAADAGGFASLWVMDHFFQIPVVGPAEREMLEGYSALSYLAAVTRRVRLGTLVTGVTYRHPGVLVKTVSTLDVLSGGRAMLGIGAAWFEREHRGLGVAFPPMVERFERLEEALRIARQMWSDDDGPFEGRHHRLAETLCVPQPLSRPHPPILIGGGGERKTLRFVARYADACNLFVQAGVEGIARKLDVLRRHCDAEGRDYDTIERTTLGTVRLAPGAQSPSDVIRELEALAGVGVQQAIVNLPNVAEIAPIETLAREVIPAIAGL